VIDSMLLRLPGLTLHSTSEQGFPTPFCLRSWCIRGIPDDPGVQTKTLVPVFRRSPAIPDLDFPRSTPASRQVFISSRVARFCHCTPLCRKQVLWRTPIDFSIALSSLKPWTTLLYFRFLSVFVTPAASPARLRLGPN